ncbi:MAG: serine hydrolase domain-containing protein, partial [Bdellovibrionales bacterium]|nr:serine hydrolase domain-containing protein [Bdellovibrionales bacterium]
TLQELASHTSGLPRMPTNFMMSDPLDPYKDYDAVLLLQFLKDFKQAAPGPYLYAYSNVGIGLLGYLLAEKLNSQTYSDYLEIALLRPLGLSHTKTKLIAANSNFAAKGHDSFYSLVPFWNLNVLEGAGVLKTTARDLLNYLKFNMDPDSSLIGRAMALAHDQLFPSDVSGTTVGLVWSGMPLGRYKVLAHGGATGGYRANLIFDKAEKLGAIVLSNTDITPTCILAPVFDVPCEVPVYPVVRPEIQAKLVGKFEASSIGLKADVFVEGGKLGIHPDGQPRLRLWAKSEMEYFIPDAKAEIIFQSSISGEIDQFELKQGGQSFIFKRL